MNNISQKSILFFFIKNFFIAVIYIYAMVAVYFSSIKIEGLHIGFYQMAFTIIHITILLLLMIINTPKSKQYNRALLFYLAGILAVIIGGYSYVKISSLLNWYL